MRRVVVGSILGIGLLFLGSVAIIDQLSGDDGAPTLPGRGNSQHPMEPAETAPAPLPVPTPRPVLPAPTFSLEVARQLASPPVAEVPVEAPAPLPPSGAPPAPGYVRESLASLEALVSARCGRLSLRLGDQLRKERLDPNGHAVFLIDLEPLAGEAKIWGTTLQASGATRPALVACAQHVLRGHLIPVRNLQPGARLKVQLVVGMKE